MAPTSLRVRDVMSREVHTVKRNDELAIADELMKQKRVRHLPVLDEDGEVCAVVSQRDLFRGARDDRAEDWMPAGNREWQVSRHRHGNRLCKVGRRRALAKSGDRGAGVCA